MTYEDGELVASFVANPDGDHWCGAIFQLHEGLGPELLRYCKHEHWAIQVALDCAEQELWFARRIVALAEHHRHVAP